MKILLVHNTPIPVYKYGGTERVIWDLGKTLTQLGHDITFLVPAGSTCDFAKVLHIDPAKDWNEQIPKETNIVHFQFNPEMELDFPYLMTEHSNSRKPVSLPKNTVFLSRTHAECYDSTEVVYNGLDWAAYGAVDFSRPRDHYHFLGKAARRLKNVKGAIRVAHLAKVELDVLGGDRINLRANFRWTLSRKIHFYGMVGGEQKFERLNASKGLIFPVRWHEPFGLAITESLYFGCPVFATPYGALPELVPAECGYLSASSEELAQAINSQHYDPRACHAQALKFDALSMAHNYLKVYERIMSGESLHAVSPVIKTIGRHLPWK